MLAHIGSRRLPRTVGVTAHEHYVVDLPPIERSWRGQHFAGIQLQGPAQLRAQTGASLGKISRFLREWFQPPLSRSGTLFALRRISEILTPNYRQVQAKLQSSQAVHVDETGWKVRGE